MFSDFIKHYDNIRFILREIFLYGCFTRSDLEKKTSASSRKVSYEIRRIQQYIESEFIKSDWEGRNKLLSLSYDSIENTKNFLVGTYQGKSFTKIDIRLYFYLLMIFSGRSGELSFAQVEDILIDSGVISYDEVSSKTIQRKIKEISEEMGILSFRKEGRTKMYSPSENILEDLTDGEIESLLSVVSMFKNLTFPTVSGHYCSDTIKDYGKYVRGIELDFEDHYQYMNLHFHPIIDEEVLWKLMRAVDEGKQISFTTNRGGRENRRTIKPHRFRYDVDRGRMYIVGFNQSGRCISSRVDKIVDVKILKLNSRKTENHESYKKAMTHSWSSVPCNNVDGPQTLKVKLTYDSKNQGYLLEKINMELAPEHKEQVDQGEYIFEKKVNDCYEMIPWLRSYAGNLSVIEPKWLRKKLDEDWKEMLKSYGVVS